jgi:hypothetical protein
MPRGRLLSDGERSRRLFIRLPDASWEWVAKEAHLHRQNDVEVLSPLLRDAIRRRIEAKTYADQVKSEAQRLFNAGLAAR